MFYKFAELLLESGYDFQLPIIYMTHQSSIFLKYKGQHVMAQVTQVLQHDSVANSTHVKHSTTRLLL